MPPKTIPACSIAGVQAKKLIFVYLVKEKDMIAV